MKNVSKLIGLVLVALFVLASCETGGTIEVTNGSDLEAKVIVQKGESVPTDISFDKGKPIEAGKKASFSCDEDGVYIVIAGFFEGSIFQSMNYDTVTLVLGNTESVTIKPK
jgi:hypothetical protein